MARFIITDPTEQTQIYEFSGSTVNIGRADSNDLVLNHPSVSRHHARLTVLPGDTTLLIDLGSLNGIYVNGQLIHEQLLADHDKINIGLFDLKYEVVKEVPFQVEAGSSADVQGLISSDKLRSSLRVQAEAG